MDIGYAMLGVLYFAMAIFVIGAIVLLFRSAGR